MKIRYLGQIALSGVLMGFANHAEAISIYKYRMPDNSVLYSQAVSRTGRLIGVVEAPALDRQQIESQRMAQRKLEEDKARADWFATLHRMESLIAQDDACKASLALDKARLALRIGLVPRPGERQGIVGGGSRLNAAYWERMRLLREAVDAARE